ncbi:hypothetical protein L226DRAFT_244261 [Lentinus tigrinus ALCF2SS1-7]|uniref:Nudix hydrolase domain-containing protein n=1 Tax=Lentinus tigrinus ALCF2SS1-6 TaxID=1328759 RepID=A0A5C2SNI9_9APHY|nr:hypothetical protein L227DRAFT_209656 [Lentinus tigrinus ALCF2SS1-6]RPD79218.1 hypothetical protein L226DRAFT_244261 [Lentinus tigrinus ALCF2SS1-7]
MGDRRIFVLFGAATAFLAAIPAVYSVIKRSWKHQRVQIQYPSSQFIIAAGAIPFQFDAAGTPKRVLLAYHTKRNQWLLSKGRKDEGEDLATTATREIFEETGYPCRLHRVPMLPTCAPPPNLLPEAGIQPHSARLAENSSEPFMVTLRPIGFDMLKLIFWYIGAVDVPYDGEDGDAISAVQPGTHQLAEGFGKVKLWDISDALEVLSFEGDKELVRTAIGILTPKA